uniref:Uncharacterized protein n=2 Tax=Mus TaxID=862507 RepID=Q8C6W4_MOUSE|nr:unnamed protein product [Mus musculus]
MKQLGRIRHTDSQWQGNQELENCKNQLVPKPVLGRSRDTLQSQLTEGIPALSSRVPRKRRQWTSSLLPFSRPDPHRTLTVPHPSLLCPFTQHLFSANYPLTSWG